MKESIPTIVIIVIVAAIILSLFSIKYDDDRQHDRELIEMGRQKGRADIERETRSEIEDLQNEIDNLSSVISEAQKHTWMAIVMMDEYEEYTMNDIYDEIIKADNILNER